MANREQFKQETREQIAALKAQIDRLTGGTPVDMDHPAYFQVLALGEDMSRLEAKLVDVHIPTEQELADLEYAQFNNDDFE
jgi:hypothetical protein